MNILIEVPAGELIDKITILQIKSKHIKNSDKLANITEELNHLIAVRDLHIAPSPGLDVHARELAEVNLSLWQVEDELRECERRKEFGPAFIALARSVYFHNDRRAAIKRAINELTGSRLIEEKSYVDYNAA